MFSTHLIARLDECLQTFPHHWDGKAAITEMREGGSRNWRQMEWIGWYFEYLCQTRLVDALTIPGPTYGSASFDGFHEAPWDFKAHASNTSSHRIIVNDLEAIQEACEQYHAVGLILAVGEVVYNDRETRAFQKWHDEFKGGESYYVKARKERGAWSRLRKVEMTLQEIHLVRVDLGLVSRSGRFQKGFRNADGSARRAKLVIDLEHLDDEIIRTIKFSG